MAGHPERFGPYRVERELGRGGMGVVYLAHDTELGRAVAVKVLPEGLANDPERMARFEREARLLASVHHPNVAGIFAVGSTGGQRYLALEYVPGETLADRLSRGPLPVGETLDVCRQVASGIEHAHDAGVVHRDLKPANVRLAPDGAVKVLDFGLAKADAQRPGSAAGDTVSPTLAFASTEDGVVLGTLPYMSPEQARGSAVDRRTDVWGLGCILFECLTGHGAFSGSSATDVLAAILMREPAWEALPPEVPPRVRELLRRCLEKERGRRLRDVGDARLELETALEERQWSGSRVAVAAAARPPVAAGRSAIAASLAALLLAAGAGLGWWLARRPGTATAAVRRLSVVIPPELEVEDGGIAADGQSLVFMARPRGGSELEQQLYRRPLDSFAVVPIAGTERVTTLLSPLAGPRDGQVRYLASGTSGESDLYRFRVPLDGSAPPTLEGPWEEGWRRWTVLADGSTLVTVDRGHAFALLPPGATTAGESRRITAGFVGEHMPTPVAGDGWLLMRSMQFTPRGFRDGSTVLDLASGEATPLLEHGRAHALTADGYLLFSRGPTLLAAPFDAAAGRLTGAEKGLLSGLRMSELGFGGSFELADDGTLAYPAGGPMDDRQLIACTPHGDCTPWSPLRRAFLMVGNGAPSSDTITVVIAGRGDNYEAWQLHAGGGIDPLVVLPGRDVMGPLWLPDGRGLVYYQDDAGYERDGVYLRAGATGEPRPLAVGRRWWPADWAAGGDLLVLGQGHGELAEDGVFVLDLRRGGPPRPLIATRFHEVPLDVSPDGRWLAFLSDQGGALAAYVLELQPSGEADAPLLVSSGRVDYGQFSADGRAFYYTDDRGRVLRRELGVDGRPTAAEPVLVLERAGERLLPMFRVLPDGRLLFLRRASGEGSIERFEIVLGFADEVRRRMALP